MIDFKNRAIYCKLNYDKETKKKKVFFGKVWGEMTPSVANTVAYKTGNGLVVIDVDVKDLSKIDPILAKELSKVGKPTVTTKRGAHWYFEHKNSKEFVNDSAYAEHVDVRSDGGLIFAQYKGNSKKISYKRTGDVYPDIPKKLLKRLRGLMTLRSKTKQQRVKWEEAPKGDIHTATLNYINRDFASGLNYDEVVQNGVDYVETYLGGTPREMKLMMTRIRDAYNFQAESRIERAKEVTEPEEMGAEVEDNEIRAMLIKAQAGGALELERTMKILKKKFKISMATMREMIAEAQTGEGGLSGFFKGDIIFEPVLGVYAEIREERVIAYAKSSFPNIVMSNSGWMKPSDVNELLCTVPVKHIVYRPDIHEKEFVEDGEVFVNTYREVKFKSKNIKKIPKNIDRLLDNLFHTDQHAKEYFIHWLAYIVQTHRPTGVAWGFFGASGTGKGLLTDLIMRILGLHNSAMNIGDNELQSTFNGYLKNTMFLHLNEIASDYHSRHGVAGKLKALVTDEYIQVNEKNMPVQSIKNFCNIILNSNKMNPIELDVGDRRWNMVVTDIPLIDLDWFTKNVTGDKMLEKYDEFGAYLRDMKLDSVKARSIIDSKAKRSVVAQTTNQLAKCGELIKKCDYKNLTDLLMLEDENIDVDLHEIKRACESGMWRTVLLRDIYMYITGKEASNMVVTNRFIKPYVTKNKSHTNKKGRYFLLTEND